MDAFDLTTEVVQSLIYKIVSGTEQTRETRQKLELLSLIKQQHNFLLHVQVV